MKGWPFLRVVFTLLGLLAAGLPLLALAPARTAALSVQKTDAVASTLEELTINVAFSTPPENFSVTYLGRKILGGNAAFESETTLDAHYPKEGIDLVFEAAWPENIHKGGAQISVTRASGSRQIQTVWGENNLFEILTFDGKTPPL